MRSGRDAQSIRSTQQEACNFNCMTIRTAFRELVVNALVHRDYQVDGSVDLEHSPEQLTVSSPGGLVFGVAPENSLTHPSTPRNRLLLETVTTLQGGDLEILLGLAALREKKTLSAESLAQRIQRSAAEAQSGLERMMHARLIEPSRRSARRPFPTYSLTASSLAGMGRAP